MKNIVTLLLLSILSYTPVVGSDSINAFKQELSQNDSQWQIQQAIKLLEDHGYDIKKRITEEEKETLKNPISLIQKDLTISTVHFNDAIKLYLGYKNISYKPITHFKVNYQIKNKFGLVLVNETLPYDSIIAPGQEVKNATYRYWATNTPQRTLTLLQEAIQNNHAIIDINFSEITFSE